MKTLLTALLIGLMAAHSASAGDRRKSLDEAVSDARERYNGRVLSAETRKRDGRESHKIRILTDDGRVKRLHIDADSDSPERRRR